MMDLNLRVSAARAAQKFTTIAKKPMRKVLTHERMSKVSKLAVQRPARW